MILHRLITQFLSFFLPGNHAMVSTITATVPLFPLHIEWLLKIPWSINRFSIGWEFTMLEAFRAHTSSFLTLLHASPDKWATIKMIAIKAADRSQTARIRRMHMTYISLICLWISKPSSRPCQSGYFITTSKSGPKNGWYSVHKWTF